MTRVLGMSILAVAGFACLGRSSGDKTAMPGGYAGRTPADELARQVQETYGGTQQLVARVRLTTFNQLFDLSSVKDGVIYFKRPGKVRLDVLARGGLSRGRVTQTLLVDRNRLWAIDVRGKWYVELPRASGALPPAILFLTDTAALSTSFDARVLPSRAPGAGDIILELTPKRPSARLARLVLVVDSSTRRIETSIVTNAAGDTSTLSFFTHDTKQRVADSWFVFDPKAAASRGFRAVGKGLLPPHVPARPAPAPAASRTPTFLSSEWLRAYHDCEELRRAKPPHERPLSLEDLQRCGIPAHTGR